MRVLIVAKTRMGKGACIGAITEKGESVRLIPLNVDPHDGANRDYEVGDVWEITGEPEAALIPPHNENFVVHSKSRLFRMEDTRELIGAIELLMPPKIGHPRMLYEGRLQNTESGRLHIAEQSGIPPYSTTFWRTDQPLILDIEKQKPRYRYPTEKGGCTFTFGGLQEPLETIRTGTLLRVSLAHWWRPDDEPVEEERCYAQISGWFLEVKPEKPIPPREEKLPPPQTMTQTPLEILKDVFKFEDFRPFQEGIIKHILNGQDALVVLPTGGGKSLCYQLPALIFDGLTVVVSPLISLMQDQVMKLEQKGIRAAFFNSTLSYSEQETTMQQVTQGEVKLLYMAPETLVKTGTLLKLDRSNVSCLAIDEAHCISQWGHDFRPDYRDLVSVQERFQNAVCVAMTATATPGVQDDIKQLLGIHDENSFITSFDRENLFITIEQRYDLLGQTLIFINKHPNKSGIIYCQRRKQVELLYQDLIAHGVSALPYHAGLDNEIRKQNQDAFINGDIRVIVATIAFGMGIDKADVRFVLHAGLPKNPESYYQEIGRAGRDGIRSECLLLFDNGDAEIIYGFIDQGAPSEREGRLKRLQTLVSWTTSTECRRKELLSYFGEEYEKQNCGMCDNCHNSEMDRIDLTEPAQKFLSGVYRTNQIFGEVYIVDVLRGSKRKRILDNDHDKIKTYGKGSEYNKEQWRYLAHQFLKHELLERDSRYGSLRLTKKGWDILKNKEKFWGLPVDKVNQGTEVVKTYESISGVPNLSDPELYDQLREKRTMLAGHEKLPAYCIFSNKALQEMAIKLPQSKEAFLQINGVGDVKFEKYADDFLPIIRDYCKEQDINSVAEAPETLNTHDATSEALNGHSPELFELLQAERDKIFETESHRVYETFNDKALQAMATYFPTSEEVFRQVSNVEPEKFKKYADIFLPIIHDYCKKHGIDSAKGTPEILDTYETTPKEQSPYSKEIFDRLREKRKTVADEEGVSAFAIFWNNTLKDMATYFPQTEEEFLQIDRVSPKKVEKYADDFLSIIRDYCKEHGINSIEDVSETSDTYNATSEQPSEYSPELFELLQTKRDKIAKAKGVLPYEVFHDEALKGMATYFPISEESFKPMSGVGPKRSEKYADDFLPIIRDYCQKHGIDSTAEAPETLNTSEVISERQSGYSQELFEQLQDKCKILENAEQEGIFTNATLTEMATSFPRTREAFVQIRGVSLRKMEKYADDFLPIIQDYCEEHGID